MKKILLILTLFLVVKPATAQDFNPTIAFAQGFYGQGGNMFRSANGAPGGAYWQNKVDYYLQATFDTTSHILQGNAEIHYQNNSPDSLSFIWFELAQNADRADAPGNWMKAPGVDTEDDKGFHIKTIEVLQENKWVPVKFMITDTRMQVLLPKPLAGKGSVLKFRIQYGFQLLKQSAAGRAGWMETPQGAIFEVAYWYPRVCVYDDLRGWNSLPFIGGGEFYCEYGDFDYKITVPSGMLVAGGGKLVDEQNTFSTKILANLAMARQSDKTTIIRSEDDVRKLCPTRKTSGTTTWHFQMKNTRDVAFAVSKSFLWDGAKINLPNGKTAFAQSFYPAKSVDVKDGWPRATEYLKASVESFSRNWFVYPYPNAINVAGPVGGMEFPGITFDWHDVKSGKVMWLLASHEIGHSWYPMIVGSNERRYPFMDEGFNTFIDIYAQAAFNHGEFAPKRDGEYAPGGGNPADEIIPVMKELKHSYNLLSAPDEMDYHYVHPLFYFKTAFGLVLLREVILGPEKFDLAFRTYTRRWAFKHPAPNDFFRTMDNVSGTDLSWFWRGWFAHNWLLDQAVTEVKYTDDKPEEGAQITIENKGQLVMPVLITIKESNGKEHQLKLPATVWSHGADWTFKTPTTSKIISVVIDEKHQLPDIDRQNNVWNQAAG